VAAPASSALLAGGDAEQEAHDDADEHVRPVRPDDGVRAEERHTDVPFDDDIAEHDTVVLGRPGGEGEGDDEDPRARIPAWEDIVFGVRRHR
jgi:hypothetical protein